MACALVGALDYHPGMPDEIARLRDLLTAALVGVLLPADVPEGQMVRSWLDSWSGVGHVAEAMHAGGYNVSLFQSPFAWWAEFIRDEVTPIAKRTGRNHDAAPWRAVQRAALETLRQEQAT